MWMPPAKIKFIISAVYKQLWDGLTVTFTGSRERSTLTHLLNLYMAYYLTIFRSGKRYSQILKINHLKFAKDYELRHYIRDIKTKYMSGLVTKKRLYRK